MLYDLKLNSKWALITIDYHPELISDLRASKIIKLISSVIQSKYVVLNYIDGTGKDWLITSLQRREHEIISLEDFYQEVLGVSQFDWGDFFLFKDYPQDWEDPEEGYPPLIAQSDTTVRVVDGQYSYIYTIYQEVIDVITRNYEIESIRSDFLSNLEYPC